MTAAEAGELLRLLAAQTPERAARVHQRLVDPASYPSSAEVHAMVAAEQAAHEAAQQGSTEVSRRLDGCDAATLRALQTTVDAARQAATLLGLEPDATQWPAAEWAVRAIIEGLAGQNSTIWSQLAAGRDQVTAVEHAMQTLGFRQVVIGDSAPGTATARLALVAPLLEHLSDGGKMRGTFKSGAQRDAEPVLDHSTVDGMEITTAEQVSLVCAALEAQACVETLGRGWAMVGLSLAGAAGEPVQQSVARVVDTYGRLDLVLRFLASVGAVRETLAAAQSWLPLSNLGDWQEFVDALDAVRLRVEAEQASAALATIGERLALDAHAGDMPPELIAAAVAVAARDADAYGDALAELADAAREQAEQLACDAMTERVRDTHPALAALMTETADDPAWPTRLADWDAAWAWGQANTFFINQRQPGREQQLEAELSDTITRLRQETASLAAVRAWGHCLRRMTAHQAQALQAYEQHMRAVGKGTGRYAGRFRTLAREAMREARDAVPAWIMPLDVVLETLAPVRDSFDVVIVDEASQASLEDLFLLWLAPRVIVVGDDKQCAPSQVRLGELEPIFAKLSSYLPELPGYLRDAYTPKSSLFDLLRTRFGAVIPLREHFRCMPEIIEYSNRLSYSDHRLVPLREFGTDRLPPLKAVHVPGASVRGASDNRKVNEAEAEAIVEQIEKCCADPTYDGCSMGVISLLGDAQAHRIRNLLVERIGPEEMVARRIKCGNAYDFQGDERKVMFLSMVVTPTPDGRRLPALGRKEFVQRFNVAASRAEDQMWLFHSVQLHDLNPDCVRWKLIDHCQNPPSALQERDVGDVRPDILQEPFDSLFEQRVYLRLREREYTVIPQYEVHNFRIDLVVVGTHGRTGVRKLLLVK